MKDREVVLKSKLVTLTRVTFEASNGGEVVHDVIEHPGASVILPVLDDQRIVLIRNHRRIIGKTLWELPAGVLEPGEPPEVCAARELEEETGYTAKELAPLIDFYASPGVLTERMHGFVATGLAKTEQNLDEFEEIEVFPTPTWEVRDMLKAGHIEDGKSITLLLYWMHLYSGD